MYVEEEVEEWEDYNFNCFLPHQFLHIDYFLTLDFEKR